MYGRLMLAAAMSLSIPAAATAQDVTSPFVFTEGQSVYVAGFQKIEHTKDRPVSPVAGLNIDSHLPAEQRVRKEFSKRQFYRVVDKVDQADFVFLVYIDSSAAEGLALAPDIYQKHRGEFDLDTLQNGAYARYVIGPYRILTLGRMSENLVKTFHEGTVAPGNAPQARK